MAKRLWFASATLNAMSAVLRASRGHGDMAALFVVLAALCIVLGCYAHSPAPAPRDTKEGANDVD